MKKIFYLLMMIPAFVLTSCDTDEMVADRLTGANWEGWLGTYYQNIWGDEFQDGKFHTVWRFDAAYYDATYGTGYEVDYSLTDRRDYAYSAFNWEVRNGNIYIDYRNRDWNNVRIDWEDYDISHNHFRGVMYDWEDRVYRFDLKNNTGWNWDDFDIHFGFRTRGAESDSIPVYVSDDGRSYASGKFAKAILNKKKASK